MKKSVWTLGLQVQREVRPLSRTIYCNHRNYKPLSRLAVRSLVFFITYLWPFGQHLIFITKTIKMVFFFSFSVYCSVKLALSEKIIKGKSKYQALDHCDTRSWLWGDAGSGWAFPLRRRCVGRAQTQQQKSPSGPWSWWGWRLQMTNVGSRTQIRGGNMTFQSGIAAS